MAIINGTTGDDRDGATLTGTAEADEIFGLEGEDWLEGLAGNDTLDGGDGGRDVAIYENDPSGITGSLTTGIVTDGFGGTDTLIGIERIYGSAFDDTLSGGGIDNLLLYALGGDDVLTVDNSGFFSNLDGGEGNDSLTSLSGDVFFEPGSGQDTVTGSSDYGILSYWFGADESDPPTSSGVVVTFTSERDGSVLDFAGDTDTFTNIDAARGTANADSFIGTTGRQDFTGHQGNDTFDGGDGVDRVDYLRSNYVGATTGVSVNLATGTATDSFGDTDMLMNIEDIRGTEFADAIIGDDEDNRFEGLAGDDSLVGGGGDDRLYGDDGSDSLFGGDGEDRLYGGADNDSLSGDEGKDWLEGGAGDDLLDGGAGNEDSATYFDDPAGVIGSLITGTVTDGFGGTDTLIGIERLRGSEHNDTLTGGGIDGLWLRGHGGDDVLTTDNAGSFSDLDAGDGDDTLVSLAGDVFFQPGAGNDSITGSSNPDDYSTIGYVYSAQDANPAPTNGIVVVFSSEHSGTVTDFAGGTDTFTQIDGVEGTNLADSFAGAEGRQQFTGNMGDDTFDGGAGNDMVDYRTERFQDPAHGVSVDLALGTATDSFGDTDTLTNIEEIRGTDFADTITGDGEDNYFEGRDGDDILDGAGGDDNLRGGQGNDTLLGGDGRDDLRGGEGDDLLDGGDGDRDEARYDSEDNGAGIIGNLTTGTVIDGWGDTDTLIGIEELRGSDFDDVLIGGTGGVTQLQGNAGDDSLTGADDEFETGLNGNEGNDTLDGGTGGAFMSPGSGNDVIIGGTEDEGFYSVDYLWDAFDEGASSGISVVFSSERDGTITDFAGDTDSFTGIDRVQGTMFVDSFTGTDGDQDFRGHGGNDFFDGGAGDGDRIDYSRPEAEFGTIGGVVVDMAAGTAIDAYGDTDTFINIERIRGTDFDDSMTGSAGNVRLEGRGGDDFLAAGSGGNDLRGGDGDDTLVSGAGGDALEGGSGGDVFVITAGGSFVYISDFEIGIDTLDLSGFARADALAAISGAQSGSAILTFGDGTVLTIEGNNVSPETLSLDDIELADEVIPSDQLINGDETPEALTGGSGNDTINGMGGDDTLTGLAGNDVMSGGDGADSLDGGDGNDSLQGDDGDDVLRGGAGDDTLEGGAGDDTLENVFGGTDLWDGGAGADTLVTDVSAISPDAGQVLSVDLTAGTHGLQGSTAGQDTLISIENFIILGAWAAEIRGDDSDNDLRGDAGNDTILGLAGNDRLSDGAGNDSVEGGAGDDTIVAGSGMDTFNGGDGYDLIEVDLSGTANGAFTAVIDLDNGEIYALEFPESNPDTLIGLEAVHLFADVDAKLFGNSEDNDLRSGQGDDALSGLGGDDTLDGQGGDDTIDGGDGVDTALYSGDQASYTLTLTSTGTTLTDRRVDGNGTDMLTDVEFLDFDTDLFGAPFNLEQFGGPTGLSETDFKSFIELYIAYFNRAPDAVGLNFWGTAFATGTTLEEMAALFEPQAETQAAYPPGTSNEEFATTVYNNVLGRVPDQDGLNFWVGVLDGGSVGRDTFILEVLRGVKAAPPEGASQEFIDQQMADAEYLANKTDIGAYFAVIKGMSDTDDASAAMAFFDGSESSISAAVTAIDGFYADALDPVDGGFLMPLVGVLDDPFATV